LFAKAQWKLRPSRFLHEHFINLKKAAILFDIFLSMVIGMKKSEYLKLQDFVVNRKIIKHTFTHIWLDKKLNTRGENLFTIFCGIKRTM